MQEYREVFLKYNVVVVCKVKLHFVLVFTTRMRYSVLTPTKIINILSEKL